MTVNLCKENCTCGRHNRKDHLKVKNEGKFLCSKCKKWKTEDQWFTRRKQTSRGAWCKQCHAEDGRERRLKLNFGITSLEYDAILKHQRGVCYICKKPPKNRRLAVDHDHKTGLVRGLLCWHCNSAIGKFNDNKEMILRAAHYVENPPATQALGKESFGVKGSVKPRKRRKRKVS